MSVTPNDTPQIPYEFDAEMGSFTAEPDAGATAAEMSEMHRRQLGALAAPGIVIEGVDLIRNRIDYAYTARPHDTKPGAVTILRDSDAHLDNTTPQVSSLYGLPVSPRPKAETGEDGIPTRQGLRNYSPRWLERTRQKKSKHHGPENTGDPMPLERQPFVNLDDYRPLLHVDKLLELDADIKRAAISRIEKTKADRGVAKLPGDEVNTILREETQSALRTYAGKDAPDVLLTKIDFYRRAAAERRDIEQSRENAARALEGKAGRREARPEGESTRALEPAEERLLVQNARRAGEEAIRITERNLRHSLDTDMASIVYSHAVEKSIRDALGSKATEALVASVQRKLRTRNNQKSSRK